MSIYLWKVCSSTKPLSAFESKFFDSIILRILSILLRLICSSKFQLNWYEFTVHLSDLMQDLKSERSLMLFEKWKINTTWTDVFKHASMCRGGPRTTATSKIEHLMIIIKQLLTIIMRCSILDVAVVLDLPLHVGKIFWLKGLTKSIRMVLRIYLINNAFLTQKGLLRLCKNVVTKRAYKIY